ncbi:MAG: ABC transporter ATP-binding protein [Rhodospirillales bacterium 20-64-7]|nr:MAG: ABC transporter ATP-binding protein [Rhodospirillales bacterium 20-64-7]
MDNGPRRTEGEPSAAPSAANIDLAALEDSEIRVDPLVQARLAAVMFTARYHGVQMNPETLRLKPDEPAPTPPVLIEWLRESGLWARGVPMSFRQLMKIDDPAPIILLLDDGGAALVVGRIRESGVLLLRDPRARSSDPAVAVDELRLKQVWSGAALLVRASRHGVEEEPVFNLSMIAKLVWRDKATLRDIAIASITITILSIVPMLMVMQTIGIVLQYHSVNTLELVVVVLVIAVVFEMLLSWARKLLQVIMAAKLDARINLMIFDRLLALPIEFFEREQAGQIAYKITQINQVREFLTGKLMNTFIDMFMVVLVLPILFYMNATLAWTILIAASLIAVIIAAFLRPLGIMTGRIIAAESAKGSVLVESVYGIRTVKALALEPMRAADWDRRVAETADLQLEANRLANWPATMVMPLQRYCQYGALTLGAFIAMRSNNPLDVGSLFGFMLLGGRVAGPLVSLATVMEDVQKAQAAIGQVGSVLNRPNEKRALTTGLRPRFEGSVEFDDVTFRYEGSKTPALDKMSFRIPAGTMLGLVGRSGSGKSTVTRLLQGINRDYSGAIKIDGIDMREINLRHLRKNFGMVLQDNFLFRGSVRDNILAGRPGLSFEDAVMAARLAGAEEFIERLPNGYDTFIQEGSPNLSGGQKQRLAIARALVSDPRVLILDEATSALDPESEALVNANLLRIAKGRTMVIVSHRLSSLLDCDLIMVLDRGRTMDIGTHHELVERCAIYRHLWLQQNRHLDPEGNAHAPKPVLA